MKRVWLCLMPALAAVLGCQQHSDTAVPRRTAYPRPYAYDTVYTRAPQAPLSVMVNDAAEVSAETRADGTLWLNIGYPRYDATIYCTFTPVDASSAPGVIDNRTHRMHLNLGSAPADIVDFTNGHGYYCTLVTAPSAVSTPVQFIAVDTGETPRWVVSGTVFFSAADAGAPVDSLSPMVAVMERDARRILDTLSPL